MKSKEIAVPGVGSFYVNVGIPNPHPKDPMKFVVGINVTKGELICDRSVDIPYDDPFFKEKGIEVKWADRRITNRESVTEQILELMEAKREGNLIYFEPKDPDGNMMNNPIVWWIKEDCFSYKSI
jgi:hypothetical protein